MYPRALKAAAALAAFAAASALPSPAAGQTGEPVDLIVNAGRPMPSYVAVGQPFKVSAIVNERGREEQGATAGRATGVTLTFNVVEGGSSDGAPTYADVEFISAESTGDGGCRSESRGVVTCEVGTVDEAAPEPFDEFPAAEFVRLTFRAPSEPLVKGRVSVLAEADQPDPDPSSNEDGNAFSVLRVECRGETATIVGNPRSKQPEGLSGTGGRDVVVAFGGDDVITPGVGDDVVCAGPGDDRVFGGGDNGRDLIYGDKGEDTIRGQAGRDRLVGGEGHDILRGLGENDDLAGGPGRDLLVGGGEDDRIDALDGQRDVVRCGPGRDIAIVDPADRVDRDCQRVGVRR